MIGVTALAAASVVFPIVFFLISFLIGFCNAAAVLVGQAYGANDLLRARMVAGTTLSICALGGVAIALLASPLARPILTAIATPPDILDDALAYARVMLIFIPVLFVFIGYTTLLRGVSDTTSPFGALLVATAVSLMLTPALICGWAGLPRLGIAGGPYAGIVAYLLSLCWLLVHLRQRSPLALDGRLRAQLRIDWPILKTLLRLGVPGGLQMVLASLSEIAVISFVNAFGSDVTAAYGAINQIVRYVQFPAVSVGITASVFAAQAIGAGRASALPRITRTAVGLSLTISGGLVILTYLFSRSIIEWFITAPATIEIAERLLIVTLWSYVVFGLSSVLQGVMRGTGTVLWPTALSIFAIWGIQVPTAYLLSQRIGLDGIWIGYPTAFAAGLMLQIVYYATVWRHKIHARLI
jgi:putative MATE family efflux protein